MEVVPIQQIRVSDTILGKGAFGEVRIAKWRNVDVAYKRLFPKEDKEVHFLSDSKRDEVEVTAENEEMFSQEIETLSKLRHPNLLLFIGICKEANNPQPSIVTELMSYSLYDLLEIQKIRLSLPDILDISLDICNGLDYLHQHEPCIIHRDISSKNILLNGKQAKIADLGQAKIFSNSVLSRQTSIPGAMAYSAPEVLTGKYSVKIDIFSFGILLCQMCTNDYPRIEKREEQIHRAKEAYPILQSIISKTLQFVPAERPTADEIGSDINLIITNDRYYPINRNLLPEKDIGILGYHLFTKQLEQQYQEIIQEKHHLQKLLTIEEKRWHDEAKKVDQLELEKKQYQTLLQEAIVAQEEKEVSLVACQEKISQQQEEHQQLLLQLNIFSTELKSFQQQIKQNESQIQDQQQLIIEKENRIQSLQQQVTQQSHQLQQSQQQQESIQQKLQLTNRQLSMQVDYCKDLEIRLEQILMRWKEEKVISTTEKSKLVSLQSLYSQVIQQKEQLQIDYQRCDQKLRQYEGLPLPEEIKLRFTDLQQENDLLRQQIQSLLSEKESIQESKQQIDLQYQDSLLRIAELESVLQQKESFQKTKALEIQQLTHQIEQEQASLREKDKLLTVIDQEKEQLKNEKKTLEIQMETLSNELLLERKLKAQLSVKLQRLTNNSASVGSPLRLTTSRPTTGSEMDHNLVSASTVVAVEGGDREQASDLVTPAVNTEQPSSNTVPVERPSEVAIKHMIERTIGREGVSGLLELIMNNPQDDRILWRALRAIRELLISDTTHTANDSHQYREIIQQTNPEIWLFEFFLQPYPTNRMIISQVMRFIGTYTFGNDLFRRKMGERQIMTFILQIFQQFPTDEMVLLHTTMALTNLTHSSKENRARFAEQQGIFRLIQLMYQHLTNSKLQIQFCWSLLTLSGSDEIAIEISQQKGDLLVIQSILTHREDASIQEYGLWTLYNLCLASPEIANLLKSKGIMELCQIATEIHSDQDKVMQQVQKIQELFSRWSQSSSRLSTSTSTPTILSSSKKKILSRSLER